jgi:UDPglucose 6-dehydrogenase
MKIAVIGSGYVGLVSGTCFSDMGHEVICVDNNVKKISDLNLGIVPIYEPGLEELILKNHHNGRLKFTTDLPDILKEVEMVIIAVGTPTDSTTLKVDLSYINNVALQIKQSLSNNLTVIIKSTVPVGTCQKISHLLNEDSEYKCKVISNPEFLREGHAINDFMNPDRIVIGSIEPIEKEIENLYNNHIQRQIPILFTNYETAELIKYASNTALACKVALINEVANICERVGGDINQVVYGVGLDNRIGNKFLSPGPGFGGSCFPKDVKALIQIADETGVEGNLIKAITISNEQHKVSIVKNIIKFCGNSVTDKVITILGLTYKANTDDVRSSPAIDIINLLLAHGAIIKAYDPQGASGAKKVWPKDVTFTEDLYSALEDSSLAVILTEWEQFRSINYKKLKQLMINPIIYDLRNVIDKAQLESEIKLYKLGYSNA